jgi:hypothetical protein
VAQRFLAGIAPVSRVSGRAGAYIASASCWMMSSTVPPLAWMLWYFCARCQQWVFLGRCRGRDCGSCCPLTLYSSNASFHELTSAESSHISS